MLDASVRAALLLNFPSLLERDRYHGYPGRKLRRCGGRQPLPPRQGKRSATLGSGRQNQFRFTPKGLHKIWNVDLRLRLRHPPGNPYFYVTPSGLGVVWLCSRRPGWRSRLLWAVSIEPLRGKTLSGRPLCFCMQPLRGQDLLCSRSKAVLQGTLNVKRARSGRHNKFAREGLNRALERLW